MLDIRHGLSRLAGTTGVELISVQNEMKELVLFRQNGHEGLCYTVSDFSNDEKSTLQLRQEDLEVPVENGLLLDYLYEPRAALMKLGAFGWICKQYNAKQVGQNSHLFTSNDLIIDFPGKIFKVIEVVAPKRDQILRALGNSGANVATRNYPGRADALRKKFRIAEGNDYHVFFTKLDDGNYRALITEPIRSGNP